EAAGSEDEIENRPDGHVLGAGLEGILDSAQGGAPLREQGPSLRMPSQQRVQRGIGQNQAPNQLGMVARDERGDVAAVGIPDQVSLSEIESPDDGGEAVG